MKNTKGSDISTKLNINRVGVNITLPLTKQLVAWKPLTGINYRFGACLNSACRTCRRDSYPGSSGIVVDKVS